MLQAAGEAYDATLAPIHTYLVRMAIKGSIYLLPDRATFISQIGETGARPSLSLSVILDKRSPLQCGGQKHRP